MGGWSKTVFTSALVHTVFGTFLKISLKLAHHQLEKLAYGSNLTKQSCHHHHHHHYHHQDFYHHHHHHNYHMFAHHQLDELADVSSLVIIIIIIIIIVSPAGRTGRCVESGKTLATGTTHTR